MNEEENVKSWLESQSDDEKMEVRELEKKERLQRQREREQVVIELTIRRVEMILLDKMGLAHINFIEEVGRGIREEMGLAD